MEVDFLASKADGQCGIGTYTRDLADELESYGVQVNQVTFDSGGVEHRGAFIAGFRLARANGDISHIQFEPGLFHTQEPLLNLPHLAAYALFFGYFLGGGFRKPLVTTMHTQPKQPRFGRIGNKHVKYSYGLMQKMTDKIFILGPVTAEKTLIDDWEYTVLPHGAKTSTIEESQDEAKTKFGYNASDTLIVLPGYVRPPKGYHLLSHVAKWHPEYEFLFAGGVRTEKNQPYKNRVANCAPENVQFTGILDDARFHSAFVAADIITLPYEFVEQSGILNYAASYGNAVVASDKGYFKWISDQWELECYGPWDDPHELEAAIERALIPDRREKLEAGMRSFSADRSFDKVASEHVRLYKQLI